MQSSSSEKVFFTKTSPNPKDHIEIRPFQCKCFELLDSFSVLTYYLLLTPYRLVVHQGVLTIKTNAIQKLLCGFLQFCCFLKLMTKLWKVFSNPIKLLDDPTRLYTISLDACDIIGDIFFFKACWIQGHHGLPQLYRSAFDISQSNFEVPAVTDWARAKSFCFWTLCHCSVFIDAITSYVSAIILDTLDDGKTWHRLKQILKRTPELYNVLGISEGPFSAIWSVGLLILSIYANLINRAGIFLLPITVCLITYELSKDLLKALKKDNLRLGHVLQYYNSIKSVLSTMNEVIGGMLVVYIVSALTFFSYYLPRVLDNDSNNLRMRIQITIYFVMFSISIVLAAEANLKFQRISEYVFENRLRVGFVNDPDLAHVLMETRHSNLGLKAYAFTITYNAIASIFSTVLTYFVILLQFQISKPN